MKNNIALQIGIVIIFITLLVFLSDPFMVWMPPVAVAASLLCVVLLMGIWIGFVMREQAKDEREVVHRMNAGRTAYLSGIVLLTLALVVQGLDHHIDPWIAATLAVMVVVKLAAHLYFEKYH